MRREVVDLYSPVIGDSGTVIAYGHYGRPVVVFPAEAGRGSDLEERGIIDAVAPLVDDGRVKLYCVDTFDSASWSNRNIPMEERAQRHGAYESWVCGQVVPFVQADCAGRADVVTAGFSMGAYHAANFTLRRADLFPQAMCFSGNYDPWSLYGWGERGDETYFNTPPDYLSNAEGDHLDWLRGQVSLLLVCGQGQWEDTTGALDSTRQLAKICQSKGLRTELDLWGHDVPHDWPSWRAQFAHHLPRFC